MWGFIFLFIDTKYNGQHSCRPSEKHEHKTGAKIRTFLQIPTILIKKLLTGLFLLLIPAEQFQFQADIQLSLLCLESKLSKHGCITKINLTWRSGADLVM